MEREKRKKNGEFRDIPSLSTTTCASACQRGHRRELPSVGMRPRLSVEAVQNSMGLDVDPPCGLVWTCTLSQSSRVNHPTNGTGIGYFKSNPGPRVDRMHRRRQHLRAHNRSCFPHKARKYPNDRKCCRQKNVVTSHLAHMRSIFYGSEESFVRMT